MRRWVSLASRAVAGWEVLANRVESLSLLYEEFSHGPKNCSTIALGAYISRICSAINMLDGQRNVVLNVDTERLEANIQAASQLGLLLSELLTNALQHGYPDQEGGCVEARLWIADGDSLCLEVKDDGVGLPDGST